jgi:CheY-like chemotaxis protein
VASRTVLVVDDDADIREAMAIVLREEGFVVEEAGDGREALAVLRAHPGDVEVVFLDLSMPGMDGRSFLEAKNADPLIEKVPVVVVSAGSGSAEGLPAQGVGQYLSKPLSAAGLLQAVIRSAQAPLSH